MFDKIRKRTLTKSLKSELMENLGNGHRLLDVVVNHAFRTATNLATPDLNQQNLSAALGPPISGAIELLPPLHEVVVSDRPSIFLQKIQLCCSLYDFSDTSKLAREKEIKRETLYELVDCLQSGSFIFSSEVMQEELIRMVSVNIFRCLAPASHKNTRTESVDPEDDDTYKDPSWPHLQLVYVILLRYIASSEIDIKIAKRYIDYVFVLKLLDLFDSEDPREREYLKTILHRIYGKFMVLRPFIRMTINNIFYRFIFETERHNGIAELLEVLGSIIYGFALPLKEEHKLFLVRTLVPLHKPKSVSTYHQQLSYCIVQFVEKDNRLTDPVIRGLMKYWPVTNCQKEVLFLGELEDILVAAYSAEFQHSMASAFRQIGRCLNSPHFLVAERALYLWNNEHILSLMALNRNLILPLIFESLEKNVKGHWNPGVHGLTANVRRMFMDMDIDLFKECQREYLKKEARATELAEQRKLTWKKLEAAAAQTVRDNVVLVN